MTTKKITLGLTLIAACAVAACGDDEQANECEGCFAACADFIACLDAHNSALGWCVKACEAEGRNDCKNECADVGVRPTIAECESREDALRCNECSEAGCNDCKDCFDGGAF